MKNYLVACLFIIGIVIYSNGSIEISADDKPEITSIVNSQK